MNVQWCALLGMFGALRQLTVENGLFNQPGAESLFNNVLLNQHLTSFTLKKCKANEECYTSIFDTLKQPDCQVKQLTFDQFSLETKNKKISITDFLIPMLSANRSIRSVSINQITFTDFAQLDTLIRAI